MLVGFFVPDRPTCKKVNYASDFECDGKGFWLNDRDLCHPSSILLGFQKMVDGWWLDVELAVSNPSQFAWIRQN